MADKKFSRATSKDDFSIPESEVEMQAVRSSGPGGQNVNKVATAIHLFFDIRSSSLPEAAKEKLLAAKDQRITGQGIIVIKASRYRSREQNREDAMRRLREFIRRLLAEKKPRKPTRPSMAKIRKRLKDKAGISQKKKMRGPVGPDD